jgi:hypothetical protein
VPIGLNIFDSRVDILYSTYYEFKTSKYNCYDLKPVLMLNTIAPEK